MSDDTMTGEHLVLEYLSEDDLHTFEGWLKFQGIDIAVLFRGIHHLSTHGGGTGYHWRLKGRALRRARRCRCRCRCIPARTTQQRNDERHV